MATSVRESPPSYEISQQQVDHASASTIIMQPTVLLIPPMMYGLTPINMICPHCQSQIQTSTTYEPGNMTWFVCGGLAFFGFILGCCLIPFCIDDMQDCRHTCPNCKSFLGIYRRM